MKLLITGATGLIGEALQKACNERGYVINYLTTSRDKIKHTRNYKGFYWNPETGEIDEDCIKGVDKIIHLAGKTIAQRWTKKAQKAIISSRIKSTNLLYELVSKNENQITQIISASAIGIYPDSISHLYDENSPERSKDFLGIVVQEWEKSVDRFKELGLIVSKVRTGVVLSNKGGFLNELVTPIKLYAGSTFGSGKQWISWIHIKDVARIYLFIAEHEHDGIFNATTPNPVKQKNMIQAIAKQLNKKIILPGIPAFALKAALGKMAAVLLGSQLVISKRLDELGFKFHYVQVKSALKDLLSE